MSGFDWSYTLSLFTDTDLWRAALLVVELAVEAWVISKIGRASCRERVCT